MNYSPFSFGRTLWRSKWNLLRLTVVVYLLWIFVEDNPHRLVRLQLSAIPPADYIIEVQELARENRYAEAIMVADMGLQELSGDEKKRLQYVRENVISQRDSLLRRGGELLRGAVIGEGDSIEALIGAISADFIVVGDVRDLLIQGTKQVVDGDSDELILALSAVGLATTVMPQVDWIAALLKVSRKTGSMTTAMSKSLLKILKQAKNTGDYKAVQKLFGNVKIMADRLTPAGTLRLMRHLDDPEQIGVVARFLERTPAGGYTLHVAQKEGVQALTNSGKRVDNALVIAAKRGDRGMAWFRTGKYRLLRPHPLIGLAKGLRKGTVGEAIERITKEYLDPFGWLTIPCLFLWLFLEVALLFRRFARTLFYPKAQLA